MTKRYLVGDIGGTSARFAIAGKGDDGAPSLLSFAKQSNDDFDSLSASMAHFLSGSEYDTDAALLAVAGPIEASGCATLSNREWPTIDPVKLCEAHNFSAATLVNDFAAMARAMPEMPDSAFVEILPGRADDKAPVLVTGPGTGFGVGTLIPIGSNQYKVLTGEGGHAAYAAHTVREAELAERLIEKHGYVSTEMIVSGAWLKPVFDTLSDMHGVARRDLSPGEIMGAAEIDDPVCLEVCQLRARSIMGAVGDGVLMTGARGGAVLTGGVAERMEKWLKAPDAIERFYNRGGQSKYMRDIPVHVMGDPHAPLIGAAALMFDLEKGLK